MASKPNPFQAFQCAKRARTEVSRYAFRCKPTSVPLTGASTDLPAPLHRHTPQNNTSKPHITQPAAEPSQQSSISPTASPPTTDATSASNRIPKTIQASYKVQKDAPGVPERLGDAPLRLIIVGHNPSAHAWNTGHYYSNPSNWMWRILMGTGIAPENVKGPEDDYQMLPAGIGFTDVGSGNPGTDSSAFKSSVFVKWRQEFYARLTAHVQRANESIGCTCGKCGQPCIVAFAGKRQLKELYAVAQNGKRARGDRAKAEPILDIGKIEQVPPDWPFHSSTELWLMRSTSGAAAMTRDQRWGPWEKLAERCREIEQHPGRKCG